MLVTEILFYTLSEVHDDVNVLIFFWLTLALLKAKFDVYHVGFFVRNKQIDVNFQWVCPQVIDHEFGDNIIF